MRSLRISVVAAALVACAAWSHAQANAWYNPCVKGVKAVESARCGDAVPLLERAVPEDPHFHLAIAYARLGNVDRVANALNAAAVVPPEVAPRLSDLRSELEEKTAPDVAAVKTTSQPPPPPRPAEDDAAKADVIVTIGQATLKRAPDVAFLVVGVEARAKNPRDAQRQQADLMTATERRLTTAGIARDALRTLGLDLQQEFDFNQGRRVPREFVARNTIEVRIDDIARVGEFIDAAVQGGATSTGGVRFDLRDRTAAEREAVRLAVADARARADAAAAGAGRAIGRVLKIEEGRDGPIVMARPMMDVARMADQAQTPVNPGFIEVRAQVTLTVSMK